MNLISPVNFLYPPIAFGILSFNRVDEVIATIEIVRRSDYPRDLLHIVVIDNCSADGTAETILERYNGEVEVMLLEENIGAVARNHVMLGRDEPYSFVFDEDCAPERTDTLRRTIEFMEAHPYFGALSLRSINHYSRQTEYEGWEATSRRRLPGGAYEGPFVAGNGMCFRRDALRGTSGYDPRIFWGSEEFCLALELLYHNIPIAYLPDIALVHRRAPRAFPPARVLEAEARNNIWTPMMFLPLPIGLLMATAHVARRLLYAALRARPDGLAAVMRGIRQGVAGLPDIMATRKIIPISRLASYNRWFIHLMLH